MPKALLDPKVARLLDNMARLQRPPLHSLTPRAARLSYDLGANVLEIAPPVLARVEDHRISTRDGALLRARLYAPASSSALGALLFFHGGGCVVGSLASHDVLCRSLSEGSGCAVVAVDYRLAPEHAFPGPVHDAWDAWVWLRQHGPALGLDPTRLAVGGDSAGATLATVTALGARDLGQHVRLQLLFYPGCAGSQHGASHDRFGQGFLLDADMVAWFYDLYAGPDPGVRKDWRFAPLLAEHLDEVAPVWLGLAECDPVVDEGIAYADRLRMAGVHVELEVYRGMVHEFIKMGRMLPQAQTAVTDAARALGEALQP